MTLYRYYLTVISLNEIIGNAYLTLAVFDIIFTIR